MQQREIQLTFFFYRPITSFFFFFQVGLAGPSGAGKTAFAQKIQDLIPNCAMLSMDNYNDGSKVIDGNFDDPRITDYATLFANLTDLKEGKPTQVPIYDFKESSRVGYRTVEVPESRVVILEGIYALSQRLRPYLDLRVSITGGVHFDLVKRVLRDIDRSGQAPEEIIQQVSDTVYPMYKAFIEPDLKAAHLRIYNPFNPFSGFMSPTYIHKSAQPVSPAAIEAVLGADAVKRTESETYDIYLVPPGEDPETCQSWLRMRYRDGRYNLMFEEWVVEGTFIISPRVTFEVPVRILGGLMALGYEIGTIMQRTTESFSTQDGNVIVKLDHIVGMTQCFVQVQSKERAAVAKVGTALGLDGSYIPHSYIELVQLDNLTQSFQTVTEDLRKRFAVNGEPLIDEHHVGSFSRGSSPLVGSFSRTIGFNLTSPSGERGGGSRSRPVLSTSEDTSDAIFPALSSSAPISVLRNSGGGGGGGGSITSAQQRGGLLSQRIHAAAGVGSSSGIGGGGGGGNNTTLLGNNNNGGAALHAPHMNGGGGSVSGSGRRGGSDGSGGSRSPDEPGGRGSRPPSPSNSAVEVQLKKLMQSQALLTSQMEELTVQLRLVHSSRQPHAAAEEQQQQQQQQLIQSQGEKRWWYGVESVSVLGYVSAGTVLGAALATALIRSK